MATAQALQEADVMDFDGLFEESGVSGGASGQWFPIRLSPDAATGELFNIGVGFLDDSGKLHTRLIPNANAFRCLYGPAGLESFGFLLAMAREHFGRVSTPFSPSPHIHIGALVPARGDSPAAILDDLYETLVTLNCEEDAPPLVERTSVSTDSVRKRVFGQMKQDMPGLFDRIRRQTPVTLRDSGGRSVWLDLPLWDDHGDLTRTDVPAVFGTIVSAHYKDPVHRGYNVSSGSVAVSTAADILGRNSRGGFLIYRPEDGAAGYGAQDMLNVENDIDKAVWMVRRHHPGTRIEISSSVHDLARAALELAA